MFTKFGEQISICQTPNRAKFCNNPTRSVQDIRYWTFVLPENVGQSSPKSLTTCYHLRPPSCQISSRSVKPAWRKALQKIFYILQYFGSPEGPPGPRVTSLVPPLATWKILSSSDDPSPRYLLPKLVDFVASVTHKKTYSKRHMTTVFYQILCQCIANCCDQSLKTTKIGVCIHLKSDICFWFITNCRHQTNLSYELHAKFRHGL